MSSFATKCAMWAVQMDQLADNEKLMEEKPKGEG